MVQNKFEQLKKGKKGKTYIYRIRKKSIQIDHEALEILRAQEDFSQVYSSSGPFGPTHSPSSGEMHPPSLPQ